MLYLLIFLGVCSVWTFISLGVVLTLPDKVDTNSWHLRFLRFAIHTEISPKSNCSYFWSMLFVPLYFAMLLFVCCVVSVGFVTCRLVYDWLVMPVKGQYAVGVMTKKYWKGVVSMTDSEYTDLPFKRFSIAAIALCAITVWLYIGYESVWLCLRNAICRKSSLTLDLMGTMWVGINFVAVVVLPTYMIRMFFRKFSSHMKKTKESSWWDFISGKICRPLDYDYKKD